MKNFLNKYKVQLVVIIYFIAIVAFLYFLVFQYVNQIASTADEIQQSRVDGEINEKKLSNIANMEGDYNKFKENESKLDITISADNEVDFIKELESLAEKTGNKIELQIKDQKDVKPTASTKIKPGEENIKDKLVNSNYLSMQIAIEGSYAGLLDFLHKLENYKNFVNVMSVSSEKKSVDALVVSSNPFAAADQAQKKNAAVEGEVLNSILDVVIYIKK